MTLLLASALAGSLGTDDTALDDVYAPRRVAVLIGVDTYSDPELDPLAFAAKDARDLAGVLNHDDFGDFDRVLTITSPDATTRQGILKALHVATADLQRDDTFVLYLSGHGTLTLDPLDGSQLWFLPSDGKLSDAPGTGIAVDWLEEMVSDVEARRRVLIMDTCHNGRDKSSLDPRTAELLAGMRGEVPTPRSTKEVSESEARLYAAQYHQPAMEDPTLQNGVYTHFLIQAISDGAREADLDGDGLVDVTEAHDWARDKTMIYTGGMQVPRAEYKIVGREAIYLAGNEATRISAEKALLAATDALLASAHVLVDGQPRGVLPEVVAVEPGVHAIEIQDATGRTLLKRTVRVQAGETVMLDGLFPTMKPSVEVLGGAQLRTGDGSLAFHSGAPQLGVAYVNRGFGPRWMEADLHLSSNWAMGTVPSEGSFVVVNAGIVQAGAGLAFRSQRVPLSFGPTLDGAVLWRSFEDYAGSHDQARPALALGGQARLRVPVRDRYVVVGYDARWIPYTWDGEQTALVTHGLSVGVGAFN